MTTPRIEQRRGPGPERAPRQHRGAGAVIREDRPPGSSSRNASEPHGRELARLAPSPPSRFSDFGGPAAATSSGRRAEMRETVTTKPGPKQLNGGELCQRANSEEKKTPEKQNLKADKCPAFLRLHTCFG
ncbi:unnamed protein product [Lampetra planeri]